MSIEILRFYFIGMIYCFFFYLWRINFYLTSANTDSYHWYSDISVINISCYFSLVLLLVIQEISIKTLCSINIVDTIFYVFLSRTLLLGLMTCDISLRACSIINVISGHYQFVDLQIAPTYRGKYIATVKQRSVVPCLWAQEWSPIFFSLRLSFGVARFLLSSLVDLIPRR